MKKIIIALVAVAVTAGAYAASISWGAAVANPGPESATGQYVYLAYYANEATLASTITIEGNGVDAIGGKTNNGGSIVAWHLMNSDEGDNGTFIDDFVRADSKGGVNGYYQIILADANNAKFAVAAAEAPVTGISDSTGAGAAQYNYAWGENDNYVGMDGFVGTIESTSTPEPTSGLLLILGVAGIALRRRHV